MPKGSVFPKVAVKKPSRSNVNLSTTRRFSCNVGTLIPALTLPVQSGDKIHMSISALVKTLPFVGPLMGSFKIQMDTFYFPYRYYNSWLHDDRTDFDPYDIKFPLAAINAISYGYDSYPYYSSPVSPGSLWNYLGVGYEGRLLTGASSTTTTVNRYFNAVPLLGYWDIFRSYYANTQEKTFPFICGPSVPSSSTSTGHNIEILNCDLSVIDDSRQVILATPGNEHLILPVYSGSLTEGSGTAGSTDNNSGTNYKFYPYSEKPDSSNYGSSWYSPYASFYNCKVAQGGLALKTYRSDRFTTWLNADTYYENMASSSMLVSNVPTQLSAFKRDDEASYKALINANRLGGTYLASDSSSPSAANHENQFSDITLGGDAINKYQSWDGYGLSFIQYSSPGYRSPVNNAPFTNVYGGTVYGAQHPREWNQLWRSTDMSQLNVPFEKFNVSDDAQDDIPNDWSSRGNVAIGRLSMDALYFASHLDRMLKRTQLAGGRYSDWNYVQYGNSIRAIVETPTFIRSHSFTLACEDVVQTSESSDENPLGSLAGRGRGGAAGRHVNFYVPEHGFMMTIFSISPYVDYSQGVSWYLRMTSLGDIHVPVLDGIGFQDLISDDLTTAYTVLPATTVGNTDNDYHYGYYGIGKQPAFIEWMTNENRVYGDFADPNRLMYMTLCRRFADWSTANSDSSNNPGRIPTDVNFSSYIDPRDWNFCFADTSLESQNFWIQLAFHITAKRVISKKIMPHL